MSADLTGMDIQPFGLRFQYIIYPVQKTLVSLQHLLARIADRTEIEVWHLRFYSEGAGMMMIVCSYNGSATRTDAEATLFYSGSILLFELPCLYLFIKRGMHTVYDVELPDRLHEIDAAAIRKYSSV